jgi:hypothetical protein
LLGWVGMSALYSARGGLPFNLGALPRGPPEALADVQRLVATAKKAGSPRLGEAHGLELGLVQMESHRNRLVLVEQAPLGSAAEARRPVLEASGASEPPFIVRAQRQ